MTWQVFEQSEQGTQCSEIARLQSEANKFYIESHREGKHQSLYILLFFYTELRLITRTSKDVRHDVLKLLQSTERLSLAVTNNTTRLRV